MNRTTAAPGALRKGVALLGVAGALTVTLAGCAGAADADAESTQTSDASTTTGSSDSSGSSDTDTSSSADTATESGDATTTATSDYVDGTYTATGSYQTPESVETISVTVTLADDVITAVEVSGSPTNTESQQYQSQFIGGIADVVVGQDVDEISVSRVAGSSLTSDGFNEALATILAEAAA